MDLATQYRDQLNSSLLDCHQKAQLCCQLAKELEEAGDYEAAHSALGGLWPHLSYRPQIDGLDQRTVAEVLLRAGTLTGWIGSSKQIEGAQEKAKNLISESVRIFESLQDTEKAAEALTDLAYCYWREGSFDEARVVLRDALSRFGDSQSEQRAVALLRVTVIENSANRFNDSLRALTEAAPLIELSSNYTLKGRFHVQLGTALKNIAVSENREDYTDRALVEYAAASFYFEQAGHKRYWARVENNLGFLLLKLRRLDEAHEHLDHARRLFVSLEDAGSVAQVDDTRARAFLAAGRNSEAEKVAREAVRTLEKGDEQALLAEALTTHGVALARLNQPKRAQFALQRAIEVAHLAGNLEGASLAALTMVEELGEHLTFPELHKLYTRADQLLANSQHSEVLARLRSCARRLIATEPVRSVGFSAPGFTYAAEQTGALLREAHCISSSRSAVLLTGETGTGKEVLAHLIHKWSGRSGQVVAINCAAIPSDLIESELFGHKKGSFTDAIADYCGAVRQAIRGTLFLDEIGELSLANQGKLLRLIENGEVHSIGAAVPEQVDVRIIAATNRNLREQAGKHGFRDDLFFRLNTFHFEIPPLRERPADIVALAELFIKEFTVRHRKRVSFTSEAIAAMQQLPLRGNARELRSLIERTVLTTRDDVTINAEAIEIIALRQTQDSSFADSWAHFSLKEEVRLFEERLMKLALKDAKGSVTRAARLLGFKHHQSLNYRLDNRNKSIQSARKPAEPRKRSIMRH
jgi:transcriptional regulator with GAF, ATPase, and Fis domain